MHFADSETRTTDDPVEKMNWGWFQFFGIAILFFGVMVIINPAFGAANIIIWTASAFILSGIFRTYLFVKLRKLKKAITSKV